MTERAVKVELFDQFARVAQAAASGRRVEIVDVLANGERGVEELSRQVIEQLVYLDLGPQGIQRIDLLCSGFLAEPDVAAGPTQVFDAGDMGCADGLAQEFRRQIAKVSIGESLEVVVSDPAAKEDLPSLARLLGQRITSTEAHDDGRLTITVERQK